MGFSFCHGKLPKKTYGSDYPPPFRQYPNLRNLFVNVSLSDLLSSQSRFSTCSIAEARGITLILLLGLEGEGWDAAVEGVPVLPLHTESAPHVAGGSLQAHVGAVLEGGLLPGQ